MQDLSPHATPKPIESESALDLVPRGLGYTLLTWGCLGLEEEGTSLAKCSDPSGYVFVWG